MLLTAGGFSLQAQENFVPLQLVKSGCDSGPLLARALTQTFLSDDEWQSEVDAIRDRYEDWEKQNSGDMGQYLNDRLILVALGASGGKVDRIKKGIVWLALYYEFDQQAPGLVVKFMKEHQGSLTRLLTDFNWDKASQYIRQRKWREDIEERKRAETEGEKVAKLEKETADASR